MNFDVRKNLTNQIFAIQSCPATSEVGEEDPFHVMDVAKTQVPKIVKGAE